MKTEPLIHVCCSDVSGKLKGKAVPTSDLDMRLVRGIGWTPTNVQITCFDTIAESPFGPFGDLAMMPDPAARARFDPDDGGPVEDFVLADVVHPDGRPWECCTRTILKKALDRLHAAAGVALFGAFEHEFALEGAGRSGGLAYTIGGFRSERVFAESLMAALRAAGPVPETFIREYGPDQYELTVAPTAGVAIADQASILREVVRAVAERSGRRASFTPLLVAGGVGNGVHIHLSFRDAAGLPATYDPGGAHGMSDATGAFIAGVLRHLPSIVAFTAASVISYRRLVPHRWSAAFNNLGIQDREAAVRLCPVMTLNGGDPHAQFNFEFRASDAAASPHLQLAAIVHAGAAGIEAGLEPPAATTEDLALLDHDEIAARGVERLPASLAAALDNLAADEEVCSWFPDGFAGIYIAHKRDEIAHLDGKTEAELCAAYAEVY